MGSVNKCIFVGNLGRDAELRYTPGGAAVAQFSMACTDVWKNASGEKQEHTEWVRCVLWGKRAEAVAEYLTKGKQVYVEGKLQTRKWQDKDGNDKYSTEVRVDELVLLGGGGRDRDDQPRGQRTERPRGTPQRDADGDEIPDEDDAPF